MKIESQRISELKLGKKLAALTCDIEEDYGFRVGSLQWLEKKQEIKRFGSILQKHDVPLTGFVVCCLLDNPAIFDFIQSFCADVQPHSFSHVTKGTADQVRTDIKMAVESYAGKFNKDALGYRFPQGRFDPAFVPVLRDLGIKYDSSIFPGIRPGVFNFSGVPQDPFLVDGFMELPFATFLRMRTVFSVSYAKLYGDVITRLQAILLGLPDVVILDSHMTDFICVEAFRKLPWHMRMAYRRNKNRGLEVCETLVILLKQLGYRFVTVREIYEQCAAKSMVGP